MRSLSEFYNVYQKVGDIGIEIEVEAKNVLPIVKEDNWRTDRDGSLRGNSAEYVTANPIPVERVGKTLDNLFKIIKDAEPIPSFRTSVHIHKNMLKYSPIQVWNAVVVYWILEDLLFNYCGSFRASNTHCLPLSKAEGVLHACLYDVSTHYPFKTFKWNDDIRYSGVNLSALRKFGTLEFRGMRGTTDPEVIKTWIEEVSKMVDTACVLFDSPADVLDKFFDKPGEPFLKQFVSFNFANEITKNIDKWEDSLQAAAERVIGLAYCTNWKDWISKMEKNLDDRIYKGTISPDIDPPNFDDARRLDVRPRVRWAPIEADVPVDDQNNDLFAGVNPVIFFDDDID